MIVGLSTFEAVLDGVSRDSAEAPPPGRRSWTGVRRFTAAFVGADTAPAPGDSGERLDADYYAYDAEPVAAPAAPPERKPDMAHFKRLHRDEVARDLDLDPTDSPAQLHRKRRSFARLNHPDRAPEDWREAATTRMTIANQLIDEALKQAAARRP
tara:strand:+ start:3771 stop:4235 length:465 start_codon:yes stop_codon:yes gene_type:complete